MSQPAAFTQWVTKAEARALSVTGLGLDELGAEGHQPGYRDAFDEGATAWEWADDVIAASGFPVEEIQGVNHVPVGRRAAAVRSVDIKTGRTMAERIVTEGDQLKNSHIRLALDQRAVTGRLPRLYR